MGIVGIYGGTFDPIHHGHLITIRSVYEKRKMQKIIFVPCNVSPHKTDIKSTKAAHRLNMVQLAIENRPEFECSDYEIKKEGISYTVDTLKYFKEFYPDLELIIGFDNVAEFDTWKDPEEILELANITVIKRTVDNQNESRSRHLAKARFINTPNIEISASEIRERTKKNLPIDFLVPENVKEYIYKLGLYKD